MFPSNDVVRVGTGTHTYAYMTNDLSIISSPHATCCLKCTTVCIPPISNPVPAISCLRTYLTPSPSTVKTTKALDYPWHFTCTASPWPPDCTLLPRATCSTSDHQWILGSDEFSKDLLLWVCVLRKTKYLTLLLAIYSGKLLVIYSSSKMFIQMFMDNLRTQVISGSCWVHRSRFWYLLELSNYYVINLKYFLI